MISNIKNMLIYFGVHYNDIIVAVTIMVSAIIVAIGLFKPFLFNKIKNESFRKAALALSNMALCFVSAFIYFLWEGWDFKYYIIAAVALWITCILTYYIYETVPGMRKVIGGLGTKAICKVFNVALLAVINDNTDEAKAEAKNGATELETDAKNTLTKVATKVNIDKDLIGL